jgi:hypothetical protein
LSPSSVPASVGEVAESAVISKYPSGKFDGYELLVHGYIYVLAVPQHNNEYT